MADALALIFKPQTDVLLTARSPEDCAERLRAAIDSDFALFGDKPVQGSVFGTSARLRKRITGRNSFQTVVHLSMELGVRGTVVRLRSGMSLFAMGFMVVWLGIVGSFLVGALAAGGGMMVAVIPFGMIVFGIGLVFGGRYMARGEHDAVRTFVAGILEAKPLPDPATAGSPIVS